MPIEGMVDALRKAMPLVDRDGCIVDIHPTETPASVRVGDVGVGIVDGGVAMDRHAAAGKAVAASVRDGLWEITKVVEFNFHTYADTAEELRDYVAATWRNGRIDERTVAATRNALRTSPGGVRPRTVEWVRLTVLRRVHRAAGNDDGVKWNARV